MQKGADIPASKSVTTPRPFYCVSRRWTSDHSHRAEYFIAAVHDHVGRNIDDYKQSRVADPGMAFQKACHIARSNAHQGDGEDQARDQNNRVIERSTGNGQHIVQRHGDVRHGDLNDCAPNQLLGFVFGQGGWGTLGVVRSTGGRKTMRLLVTDVPIDSPRYPKQKYSAPS